VIFLSVMGWKVLRELELLPGPSKNGHR
jgi:hypothetical protein